MDDNDSYSDDISKDEEEEVIDKEFQRPKTGSRNGPNGSWQESAGQSGDAVLFDTIITTEEELLFGLEDIALQTATNGGVTEKLDPPQNLYVKLPDGVFIELTEQEIASKWTIMFIFLFSKIDLCIDKEVDNAYPEKFHELTRVF